MKMIHSCFLNSTLGSLELNFCIFQMGFCWSVCVAISLLFSIFNNSKSETIYDTKTPDKARIACTVFAIVF